MARRMSRVEYPFSNRRSAEMSSIVEKAISPDLKLHGRPADGYGTLVAGCQTPETLPSSLQVRSLLWDCQRKSLNADKNNWVFLANLITHRQTTEANPNTPCGLAFRTPTSPP